jgi:conjugal transfer/type IV secretion protein DotA/TraY
MKRKILLLLGLIISSSAFAGNLFEPMAQSKAVWILQAIAGGLLAQGGGDPLLAGLKLLNAGMLTIGGVLAAYTILSSVLSTAHDGEMLGKKFSSVWIPIRYSLGTALLVPFLSGGYCVIQALVMWVILQGVGLADQVWAGLLTPDSIKSIAAASIAQPDAKKLGYNIYMSQACMLGYEKVKNDVLKEMPDDVLHIGSSSFGITTQNNILNTKYLFGDKNEANGFKQDTCGVITVAKYSVPAVPDSSGIFTSVINVSESLQSMVSANQQNSALTSQLITTIGAIAQTQVNSARPIELVGVESAISAYQKALFDNATAIVLSNNGNDAMLKSVTNDGWVGAGLIFNKLVTIQDMAQRSASNIPDSSGPSVNDSKVLADRMNPIMTNVQDSLKNSGAPYSLGFSISKQEGGSDTSWTDTIIQSVKRGFDFQIIFKRIISGLTKTVINDKENPFLQSERIGGDLLGSASAILAGLIAINVIAGIDPGIAVNIGSVVMIFLPPMFLVGALLKYVIPNLAPFLFWGGVVGWCVLVVEALIASPLWIAMHLFPEGHDVVGKGSAGYSLMLSLLLRPTLIILGFWSALTISQVMGSLINATFGDQWVASMGDDNVFLLIIGMIFQPLVYFGFLLMFLKKCLDLIHIVPDQILKWTGGAAQQLGHFAQSMGSTEALAGAVGGAKISGQLSGALGKGLERGALNKANSLAKAESQDSGTKQAKESFIKSSVGGGSGSESGSQKSSSGEGLNDIKQAQAEEKFNNALDIVGGKDSAEGKEFAKNLDNNIKSDPSKSADSHLDSAIHQAISTKFGMGSGSMAGKIGGGYSGEKFKGAVAMFDSTAKALANEGMDGNKIKSAIENANRTSFADFKNSADSTTQGGKLPLEHFANRNLQSLKDSVKMDS